MDKPPSKQNIEKNTYYSRIYMKSVPQFSAFIILQWVNLVQPAWISAVTIQTHPLSTPPFGQTMENLLFKWTCLKMWYTTTYLDYIYIYMCVLGKKMINQWMEWGTLFSQKPISI